MSDLISRQAAIDAFTGVVILEPAQSAQRYIDGVIERIQNLPSAPSEIIRCKDCKHTYLSDNFGITAPWLMCKGHIGNVYKVNDDDFCSWGERKTDG